MKKRFRILQNFNMSGRLGMLSKAQDTIVSAAFVIGVSGGLSALLGLIKSRLLTTYFGVTDVLGVFYTADRIPSLIYGVLIVGAVSTVFVPIFTEELKKNKENAWAAASSIIGVGFAVFLVLAVTAAVFAPQLITIISGGQFDQTQTLLGANLMRVMLLAQTVLIFSSFVTSILHSFKRFMAPAFAPVIYNLGMIGGIIVFSDKFGIYGPAIGTLIGAIMHLIVQLPALSSVKFRLVPNAHIDTPQVRELLKLIPARIGSVLISNLIATINNGLAIILSTSAVVLLKFASQLQFFPVYLFGTSMATASLPVLSDLADPNEKEKFKQIFLTTLHQMMFLVIPASVILLVLRIPVVRLIYGVSNFPWEATVKTSYALAFFSLSIFAQSAFYLLTRAFYALKDTVTPVKVSLLTIIINVSLSMLLVYYFRLGVWALALTFSITSIIDALFLLYLLGKRLGGFEFENLVIPFVKISYSAFFMGISLYMPLKLLDQFVFDTTRTVDLLALTVVSVFAGVLSYATFTTLFRVEEVELLYRLLRKLNISKTEPVVIDQPTDL